MKMLPKCIPLLSLATSTVAQGMPQEDASMIAYRAYGKFIKDFVTGGQTLQKNQQYVYVTPPTEYFIRGGDPAPEAVTNFDLEARVDPLQSTESPLFEILNRPKYVDSLQFYPLKAQTGTRIPTETEQTKLSSLEIAFFTALEKYNIELEKATAAWSADAAAQAKGTALEVWAKTRAPLYLYYKDQQKQAWGRLMAYKREIEGVDSGLINDKILNIQEKALLDTAPVPGYNMPVFPGDYEVKPVWSLEMKNIKAEDWTDMGFSSSVSKRGGGLFGLISKTKLTTKETTEFNQWSKEFRDEVSITLTLSGAPFIGNVAAGYWDVDARRMFPTLRPYETDPLVGNVRTQKFLVGYGVSLNITFTNMTTWNSVTKFVEEVRQDSSFGIRIFGIGFGSGGSRQSFRNKTDIKMDKIGDKGTIYIPPTPPGLTYMLGALGSKI
ncbi:hypothetical protein K469DRAFT_693949 [Zopfia rhizophila CBS 207.26]|uniref:Uncharacterized protein n=1 Tax=Zopfia rhizophila CBS 207.26 TaxID=1314779 RepID=A0A6A6DKV0_9PEZI|nr:hypothetical protein K469DRAFT_693949 [Zopfia rhizophila CBS 207.26]